MFKIIKYTALLTVLLIFIIAVTPAEDITPSFSSENGTFQVHFTGKAFFTLYRTDDDPSWLIPESDNDFFEARVSLFADMFIGEHLYSLVELRTDRGEAPSEQRQTGRLEQAFVRYTPFKSKNINLQIGKFVNPFGNYSQRHDSKKDPFIRPPLLHDYRTVICPFLAPSPGENDKFIAWKDSPQIFRPGGAPIIWGTPYQFGGMIFGGFDDFNFRLAGMNSAVSSDPTEWDLNMHQTHAYSVIAHIDYDFTPALNIGASYHLGPYSEDDIRGDIPKGKTLNDYDQEIYGLEATFMKWRIELRTELIWDRWEVPNVIEDPKDFSCYLEGKYKFLKGWYLAARYNEIDFNEIQLSTGGKDYWDYDVKRYQFGAGYKISRNSEIKAEFTKNKHEDHPELDDDLLSLRWVLIF